MFCVQQKKGSTIWNYSPIAYQAFTVQECKCKGALGGLSLDNTSIYGLSADNTSMCGLNADNTSQFGFKVDNTSRWDLSADDTFRCPFMLTTLPDVA